MFLSQVTSIKMSNVALLALLSLSVVAASSSRIPVGLALDPFSFSCSSGDTNCVDKSVGNFPIDKVHPSLKIIEAAGSEVLMMPLGDWDAVAELVKKHNIKVVAYLVTKSDCSRGMEGSKVPLATLKETVEPLGAQFIMLEQCQDWLSTDVHTLRIPIGGEKTVRASRMRSHWNHSVREEDLEYFKTHIVEKYSPIVERPVPPVEEKPSPQPTEESAIPPRTSTPTQELRESTLFGRDRRDLVITALVALLIAQWVRFSSKDAERINTMKSLQRENEMLQKHIDDLKEMISRFQTRNGHSDLTNPIQGSFDEEGCHQSRRCATPAGRQGFK